MRVLLAILLLSSLCAAQEQYQKQIEFWSKRLVSQPRSFLGREKLARALMTQARVNGDDSLYAEAEGHLKDALKFAPKNRWQTKAYLASTMMKRHGFLEALEELKGLEKEVGEKPTILRLLGDAYHGIGKKSQAEVYFKRYAEIAPGFSAWVRLGGKENLMKALKASDQLDIEPRAWIRLRLGIHELKAENYEEAKVWFEESRKVLPDYYLAVEHLAEIEEIRGNYPKAKELLLEAMAKKRSPEFLVRLSEVESQLGNESRAANLETEAIELAMSMKDNPAKFRDVADILYQTKTNFSLATELVKKDLMLRPNDTDSLALLESLNESKS